MVIMLKTALGLLIGVIVGNATMYFLTLTEIKLIYKIIIFCVCCLIVAPLLMFGITYIIYDCSVCGERAPNDIKWNYCPYCGACMEGENNESINCLRGISNGL